MPSFSNSLVTVHVLALVSPSGLLRQRHTLFWASSAVFSHNLLKHLESRQRHFRMLPLVIVKWASITTVVTQRVYKVRHPLQREKSGIMRKTDQRGTAYSQRHKSSSTYRTPITAALFQPLSCFYFTLCPLYPTYFFPSYLASVHLISSHHASLSKGFTLYGFVMIMLLQTKTTQIVEEFLSCELKIVVLD